MRSLRLCRLADGAQVELRESDRLGAGGEAAVYALADDPDLVAKVYHRPQPGRAEKLRVMLSNPPENPQESGRTIAWPVDLLVQGGRPALLRGFLMPRVSGMKPVHLYYRPSDRRRNDPSFSYKYLHRTARNIAAAVEAVHAQGYVVGDVNQANILAAGSALVTLVDVDSFQVPRANAPGVFRCTVGRPEFTPPELFGTQLDSIDRAPHHDTFGLAVLVFLSLFEGVHPFSGVYQAAGDPPGAHTSDPRWPLAASRRREALPPASSGATVHHRGPRVAVAVHTRVRRWTCEPAVPPERARLAASARRGGTPSRHLRLQRQPPVRAPPRRVPVVSPLAAVRIGFFPLARRRIPR